jgi:hypothetical protein
MVIREFPAAFEHPVLSRLYPVPTHGTLRFCRIPPSLPPVELDEEELPFIVGGGPALPDLRGWLCPPHR